MDPKLDRKISNLNLALLSLEKALAAPIQEERDLAGIIKSFEFVYELSWKALRAYLEAQGREAFTPREVFEAGFDSRMIDRADVWPKIMKDRNLTVHTYDQKFAAEMVERIRTEYLPEFQSLFKKL